MDALEDYVKWHHVEGALQETEADVFEIFDCCYAGNFRSGGFSGRSFEYLAACSPGNVTRIPGPSSFTSGLIWALGELAEERGMFTTSELSKKIKEKPGFPSDQDPVLKDRSGGSWKRIVLAPLSPTKPSLNQNCISLSTDRVLLQLKFIFDVYPKDRELANLARAVTTMILDQDIVRDVTWGGIHAESDSRPPVSFP